MSAVERAARAGYDASRDAAETEPWEDLPEWGRETFRAFTRAALAAAAPTVEQVADALHGHPVKAAPYLGVWECTCGAPIRQIRDQAEQVVALWGAL